MSGVVEVLLTGPIDGAAREWAALVRPAKKVAVGERLLFADEGGAVVLEAEVVGAGEFGERRLRFQPVEDFRGVLERIGSLPLPPYIRRGRGELNTAEDRERYQTVYARAAGAGALKGRLRRRRRGCTSRRRCWVGWWRGGWRWSG